MIWSGWDSHNHLAMALDLDGCLHLSGNMHADPLVNLWNSSFCAEGSQNSK